MLKLKTDNIKQEIIESDKFENLKELLEKLDAINDEFVYIEKDQLSRFLFGEDYVCCPAVYSVIRSLEKVLYSISLTMSLMEEDDTSMKRKMLIVMTHRLSRLFDLMYAATLDDKDSVFYSTDPQNPDLLLLTECMDFEMPSNLESHKNKTIKGVEDFH